MIFDYGALPADEPFHELAEQSRIKGVDQLERRVEARPQTTNAAEGDFELHRIGDAVLRRKMHAAIIDALRLCHPWWYDMGDQYRVVRQCLKCRQS